MAQFKVLLEEQKKQFEELRAQQAQTNQQLKNIDEKVNLGGVTEQRQKELFEGLQNALATHINQDFFTELNAKVANAVGEQEKRLFNNLWQRLTNQKDRLNEEIKSIDRQMVVNLSFGSLITIAAFVVLGYTIWEHKDKTFEHTDDFVYAFAPRVLLSIFVEIFAYFFLRLYKQGLAERKYYQNEITTIEMKISALYTAIHFGQSKDVSTVIGELLRVERNFILKKGETTAEIEKARIEQGNQQSLLKLVSDITGAIKNGGNDAKKEK
ncbi:hypothetical protein [Flexibacter flexilis]|nr:hypothetical protein [Flexibacter flexilis]